MWPQSYKWELLWEETVTPWRVVLFFAVAFHLTALVGVLYRGLTPKAQWRAPWLWMFSLAEMLCASGMLMAAMYVVMLLGSYEVMSELGTMLLMPLLIGLAALVYAFYWFLLQCILIVPERYLYRCILARMGGRFAEAETEMEMVQRCDDEPLEAGETEPDQASEKEIFEDYREKDLRGTMLEKLCDVVMEQRSRVHLLFSSLSSSDNARFNAVLPWGIAGALLLGAIAMGCFGMVGVHITCGYCDPSKDGGETTRFRRSIAPPYVCESGTVCHAYTVLPEDGSSSMIVVFHLASDVISSPWVEYHKKSAGGAGKEGPAKEQLCAQVEPMMEVKRVVAQCALSDLDADSFYMVTPFFMDESGAQVSGDSLIFRTLPSDPMAVVSFIVLGDLAVNTDATNAMADLVGEERVYFVGLGGDLTYDNALLSCYFRWDWLIDTIQQRFIYYEPRIDEHAAVIPSVALTIGNHESGGYDIDISDLPPYLFDYFPHRVEQVLARTPARQSMSIRSVRQAEMSSRGREAFHVHRVGSLGLLLALDTNHAGLAAVQNSAEYSHANHSAVTPLGESDPQQKEIVRALSNAKELPWRFSMYHVPMYPASYLRGPGKKLRKAWESLFLEGGLDVAFENHEHCYKRTKLLANGEESDQGILYIGGGAFGVDPLLFSFEADYATRRLKIMNYLRVDMDSSALNVTSKNDFGAVIDAISITKSPGGRRKLTELCGRSIPCY